MGVLVVPPGNPAKFSPFKMLCFTHKLLSLVLIILTKSFLRHSNSIMGRVLLRQNSYSCGLGIGKICDDFHSDGIIPVRRQCVQICV